MKNKHPQMYSLNETARREILGLSMSLLNNLNHQIYPVRFTGTFFD